MASKSLVILGILLIPSLTWAQKDSTAASQFYQTLKKAPSELEASGLVFGQKLRAAIAEASPHNVAQMKIALMDVLLTLQRVRAESKALNVLASGKDLHAALDNYLRQQEKTIIESGPEIIRVAADEALTADEKRNKIQGLIERNRRSAAAVEAPFTKALMAFALEHDLAGEPTMELRELMPPDKSCKVAMPELTENKTSDINGVKNTYYLAEQKNGVLMLSYADVAPASEEGAALQKRLDEARVGVLNKLNMKITKESPITLDKYPGRELEGVLPDQSVTRIRLFIVNGRLYQMWVVGSPTWAVSAEATRFFTSLELVR